ncbi:MAG: response regulator [Pseudomonadota bacterium]
MPTVLIVDDNSSLAFFSAFTLEQEIHGLKVLTTGSCEEARAVADQHHPSVFIVDLKLPDGNGLDLIDELRRRTPHMIPILVTATPLPADPDRNLFGMLGKPYDPESLIELVRRGLKLGDPLHARAVGGSHPQEAEPPSPQYDFHLVQNRLSGLLVGIRALRLELHAVAGDPSEVLRIADEYADRLAAMVKEAAEALKRKV